MSGPVILDFDRYMDFFEQDAFTPNGSIELSFHRLMANSHAGFPFSPGQYNGLDPCFYPEEIIIPACKKAIKRLEQSNKVNNPNFHMKHGDIIPGEFHGHDQHLIQRTKNNIGILQYYLSLIHI